MFSLQFYDIYVKFFEFIFENHKIRFFGNFSTFPRDGKRVAYRHHILHKLLCYENE